MSGDGTGAEPGIAGGGGAGEAKWGGWGGTGGKVNGGGLDADEEDSNGGEGMDWDWEAAKTRERLLRASAARTSSVAR